MRQAWKEWPELTVELRNIPPQTRTVDLWRYFHSFGDIVLAQIIREAKGNSIGVARVRFSPVPERSFWDSETIIIDIQNQCKKVRINLLRFRGVPTIKSPIRAGIEYPEQKTMRPVSLDFGFLSQENSMDIMKTIKHDASSRHQLQMTLDLKYKQLIVRFPCAIPDPRQQEPIAQTKTSEYRMRIQFGHLDKVYRVNIDQTQWALVIPLKSPPAFFRRRRKIEDSHSTVNNRWVENDAWQRTDEIVYHSDLTKDDPVGIKRSHQFINVGRWTTYRLLFRAFDNDDWRVIKNALLDFNIKVMVTNGESFTCQPGRPPTLWDMIDAPVAASANDQLALLHDSDSVHLPFELRYQLEAAISQGVFSEQSLTLEFLKKLEKLNNGQSRFINKAKNMLEYVTDTGKRIFDPMSIFEDRAALTHYPQIGLPEYCNWVRKVIITPSTVYLGSPTVETTNRVLRQYANNANRFIRVQFTDEKIEGRMSSVPNNDRNDPLFRRVYRTLQNGIQIGDRCYEFLAFGNSQFRENGAYFFCPSDSQSCDDIRDWMGDFSHIKVVAKYAARLGQCFSTTRAPQGIAVGQTIKEIAEIETEYWCFSDGVGMISHYLATSIARKLDMHKQGTTPSAFQFRLGGNKGIVVIWPEAKFNEIHLRPSQKKFDSLSKSIEIIRPSRFSVATLNRQTINILSCLGVPDEVFTEMTKNQLAGYELAMTDPDVALKLLERFADENGTAITIAQMIRDGFMTCEEPFMQATLQLWRAWSMKQLREKARIIVENGAHLLGCVDETNTLRGHTREVESDTAKDRSKLPQIFLQIPELDQPNSYKVVEGLCVVGRNPSLHPGDLRVVEAVDVKALRHLRNVVVFPSHGDQDIPSMCSGGDLDGDEFFVLFDPKLIPDEWNHPPMIHDAARAKELNRDVQIKDIVKFFVEYMKNDSLGTIANAHLAMSDCSPQGPKDERCLKLARLHSNAVDYVKTGNPAHITAKLLPVKYPHFMEKNPKSTYRSSRVLGKIYDVVSSIDFSPKYDSPFDKRVLLRYRLSDDLLGRARAVKSQYDMAMRRIMNQREIKTEFEVWSTFVLSKPRVGTDYKVQEDMGFVIVSLRDRFIKACMEAAGAPNRDQAKLYPFVAAMYRITWEEVQLALQECKETWVIEGHLIPKRQTTQEHMPLISFPWLFGQELGRIACNSMGEGLELDHFPAPTVIKTVNGDRITTTGNEAIETEHGKIIHRGAELFRMPETTGENEYEVVASDEYQAYSGEDFSPPNRDELEEAADAKMEPKPQPQGNEADSGEKDAVEEFVEEEAVEEDEGGIDALARLAL
ncbi:RNA dependent RNA polymerase-domain-containing protein [Pseudomassariella vexata]|uniref:RNA-dependent RNA polymerase n=1 Tax=Pseudomassariella vexata TaxID=1141098 RepID=A0A1Y2DMQ9_9PEZI|nr:RNA dependent RNA polymerase-domain-containing protein [Pseudomassariella vexata]ORY60531.1 RNA dependent RNA polymerase-domain-containing protein [Pseudomassariella vexata]